MAWLRRWLAAVRCFPGSGSDRRMQRVMDRQVGWKEKDIVSVMRFLSESYTDRGARTLVHGLCFR